MKKTSLKEQTLSKAQMSLILGGKTYECVAFLPDGSKEIHKIEADDIDSAIDKVFNSTGANQVNCTLDLNSSGGFIER